MSEELDGANLIKNRVTDASRWADSFNWHLVSRGEQPLDPGLMIAWFANAMCVQMDVTKTEYEQEIQDLRATLSWSERVVLSEIQKRDKLLGEAKILLTENTHKLSQEQWLKEYGAL